MRTKADLHVSMLSIFKVSDGTRMWYLYCENITICKHDSLYLLLRFMLWVLIHFLSILISIHLREKFTH